MMGASTQRVIMSLFSVVGLSTLAASPIGLTARCTVMGGAGSTGASRKAHYSTPVFLVTTVVESSR